MLFVRGVERRGKVLGVERDFVLERAAVNQFPQGVVLQLIGTMASLYLPSLNADIIDKGVVSGDTGYIVSTGAWMLLVTLVQAPGAFDALRVSDPVIAGDS